jgi:hypothetical protein
MLSPLVLQSFSLWKGYLSEGITITQKWLASSLFYDEEVMRFVVVGLQSQNFKGTHSQSRIGVLSWEKP